MLHVHRRTICANEKQVDFLEKEGELYEIRTMPNGYDAVLDNDAANLSI